MCVIIHIGAKQTISKQILQNCYDRNSDGWGIMWPEGGKVNTVKDVSSFDEFYKAWRQVPLHVERGVHFRIRTHGEKNRANCHPFKPREDVGLMHNGVIQSVPLYESSMSDTYNFTMYEVSQLIDGWDDFIKDEAFKKLIEDVTGYSKLLFMDGEGRTVRTKESMWTKHDGIYFSNANSLQKPVNSTYVSSYDNRRYDSFRARNTFDADKSSQTNKTIVCSSGSLNRDDCGDDENLYETWKKSRANTNQDATEETVVSDLYSGNKTEAEGAEYIRRMEEEQQQDLNNDKEELRKVLNGEVIDEVVPFPEKEVTGDTTEEEEVLQDEAEEAMDIEPECYMDLDYLVELDFKEILDHFEDFPNACAYTMKALIDTCANMGMFKQDLTAYGFDLLNDKKAVNT